jgi:hypothetical protein
MKSFALLIAATASVVNALAFPELSERHGPPSYPHPGPTGPGWNLKQFTSLVVFGDSYSDDSLLGYFINSGGKPPPVGWVNPPVSSKNIQCQQT